MPETSNIREIGYMDALRFYRRAKKGGSVSISEKGNFYGYYYGCLLVGVISVQKIGKSVRIKTFLVDTLYRGEGIGTKLLDTVLYDGVNYSAFSTDDSYPLFLKRGFVTKSINKRGIKYMKK